MRYIVPPASRYPEKFSFLLSHLMARPVDRSGSIDLGPDVVVLNPIPALDASFALDFAEICRRVAAEIASSSELPLAVLWSGGIDSTCVLCAFLSIEAPVDVALSDESVKEYPKFYERVIVGNPLIRAERRFENITDHLRSHEHTYTHVTGEIADQIYFINYPGYGLSNEELFDAPVGAGIPPGYMRVYQPLIDACPVALANNYDFLWWENFALKYQSVQARIHFHAGRRLRHVVHFFDHPLFQRWAMANDHRVKCPGGDIKNHKYPAKKLIHEIFADPSVFLMWKQKSLVKAIGRGAGRHDGVRSKKDWYIDEHWNVHNG